MHQNVEMEEARMNEPEDACIELHMSTEDATQGSINTGGSSGVPLDAARLSQPTPLGAPRRHSHRCLDDLPRCYFANSALVTTSGTQQLSTMYDATSSSSSSETARSDKLRGDFVQQCLLPRRTFEQSQDAPT